MSSFAVYLFHSQSDVRNFFIYHINIINNEYTGTLSALIIFIYLILIYILSILIDQLRIFIWKNVLELKLFKK